MPKKVVILASGNGTNTANICRFFHRDNKVAIISVFTNNPLARVIERVKEYGIRVEVFDKISFNKGDVHNSQTFPYHHILVKGLDEY